MFGRSLNPDPKFPEARPAGSEPPLARTPSGIPSGPLPGNKQASVIGPDLSIIGQKITLVCKSTLIVTGEIVGDINGSEVTVGDTGKVTGTITARNISVHGEVKGALRAETVTLHASAHIDGDSPEQPAAQGDASAAESAAKQDGTAEANNSAKPSRKPRLLERITGLDKTSA